MSELLEIYRRARPTGTHTREQIKAWGEEVLCVDAFSPRRLQELVDDPDDGIDAFLARKKQEEEIRTGSCSCGV